MGSAKEDQRGHSCPKVGDIMAIDRSKKKMGACLLVPFVEVHLHNLYLISEEIPSFKAHRDRRRVVMLVEEMQDGEQMRHDCHGGRLDKAVLSTKSCLKGW